LSSQLNIQQKNAFAGKKEYRFFLQNPSFGRIEVMQPDGWADGETTYSRHKIYKSVLRSVSTNELTFYKKGKEFLQNVYEAEGIDAECLMTVTKLNKSTNNYDSYPSAGKIDFSTYIIDEIGAKVGTVDDNFHEKTINRDSTELNLFNTKSIDGYEIALAIEQSVVFPDTNIINDANWDESGISVTDIIHIVPLLIDASTFPSEARTPTTGSANIDKKTGAYFQSATRYYILTLAGTIDYTAIGSPDLSWEIVHLNSADVVQSRTGIGTVSGAGIGTVNYSIILTLATGDSVNMQGTRSGGTSVRYGGGAHTINETYIGSPAQTSKSFPYYEAFLRLSQLIHGKENPFYSEYFGRTDTPLTIYAADGELGHLIKGIYIRIGTGTEEYPLPLSFKGLFESLSSIFNLGMGIETIGGEQKIRIENIDYFFNSTIVLDISERIRTQDIQKSVIPERFYKSLSFGFNKFTYEEQYGMLEFNTKSTWSTVIKSVFNELKKIGKYRADSQGMRTLLNFASSADYEPTKDVKGDDDIFLIDIVRDGSDFLARTNEGFDYIGGSVYGGQSFNLNYTPARSLRRWGEFISGFLRKKENTYLNWQNSDKNTTLVTRLATEIVNVIENADILVNDLGTPLLINEKYTLEVPLTTAELNLIDSDPNQLIKIDSDKYGWILEMKTKNKGGMTNLELIRFNTP